MGLSRRILNEMYLAGYCPDTISFAAMTESTLLGAQERMAYTRRHIQDCRDCYFATLTKSMELRTAELLGPRAIERFQAGVRLDDLPGYPEASEQAVQEIAAQQNFPLKEYYAWAEETLKGRHHPQANPANLYEEAVYTILVADYEDPTLFLVDEVECNLEEAQAYAEDLAEHYRGPLSGSWIEDTQVGCVYFHVPRDPDLRVYVFQGSLQLILENPYDTEELLKKLVTEYAAAQTKPAKDAVLVQLYALHTSLGDYYWRGVSEAYLLPESDREDVFSNAFFTFIQKLDTIGKPVVRRPLDFYGKAMAEAALVARHQLAPEPTLEYHEGRSAKRVVAPTETYTPTEQEREQLEKQQRVFDVALQRMPHLYRRILQEALSGKPIRQIAQDLKMPNRRVVNTVWKGRHYIRKFFETGGRTPKLKPLKGKAYSMPDDQFTKLEESLYDTDGNIEAVAERHRLIPHQILAALKERGLLASSYRARVRPKAVRRLPGTGRTRGAPGDYEAVSLTEEKLRKALERYGSTENAALALRYSRDVLMMLPFYKKVRAEFPTKTVTKHAFDAALEKAHGVLAIVLYILNVEREALPRVQDFGYTKTNDIVDQFKTDKSAKYKKRFAVLLRNRGAVNATARALGINASTLTGWLRLFGLSGRTIKERLQRTSVLHAVKKAKGNLDEAARFLGVSKSTVKRWLDRYQIKAHDFRIFMRGPELSKETIEAAFAVNEGRVAVTAASLNITEDRLHRLVQEYGIERLDFITPQRLMEVTRPGGGGLRRVPNAKYKALLARYAIKERHALARIKKLVGYLLKTSTVEEAAKLAKKSLIAFRASLERYLGSRNRAKAIRNAATKIAELETVIAQAEDIR